MYMISRRCASRITFKVKKDTFSSSGITSFRFSTLSLNFVFNVLGEESHGHRLSCAEILLRSPFENDLLHR